LDSSIIIMEEQGLESQSDDPRETGDELDAPLHSTEVTPLLAQTQDRTYIPVTPLHRKSLSIGGLNAPEMRITNRHRRGPGVPVHRKNKSSISELLAFASGTLEPLREDFQEVAFNLKKQFVKDLNTMDRGETGNFDMSLTRSLSVLPDNVIDLAHEVGLEAHDKEGRRPIIQYVMLLSAVAAISSNSTALHMLDGVAPSMKLFWRMSASYLVLSPVAIHYFIKDGIPKLSFGGWSTFFTAALCYSAQNGLFYSSLQYTTIGNAVIYSNSQALLLILGKAFVGEPIHLFEGVGVVVAFGGAILCSMDSEHASEEKDEPTTAIYGDCLALAAAVVGVMYLTCAKAVRGSMSVTFFIFCVMFFGSLMVLLCIALTDGERLEWNMDPHVGVFGGFSTYNERILVLLYLALVCNCLGTMGIVRAMEYFDNVVIAVATLMEPLLASLIAYAFHAGILPGLLGWFGNVLVVLGTLAVVYPSMNKKDSTPSAN
jgi:drug/metabolite transporter (DMT)-like permease